MSTPVVQYGAGALVWKCASEIAFNSKNQQIQKIMQIALAVGMISAGVTMALKKKDSFAARFSMGFAGMAFIERYVNVPQILPTRFLDAIK